MTDIQKCPTVLDPDEILLPCCTAAFGMPSQAVPTLWMTDPVRIGYVLQNDHDECTCPPRFLPHDWERQGHAQFIRR